MPMMASNPPQNIMARALKWLEAWHWLEAHWLEANTREVTGLWHESQI